MVMSDARVTARLIIDKRTLDISADPKAQEYYFGQTLFSRADYLLIAKDFEQGIGLLYEAKMLLDEHIESLLRGLLFQETAP